MNVTILAFNIALIIISIGFLWKGSEWLVTSSSKLAHSWGVSDLVIGLTVIAIGTSAPEFAVTISAVIKGNADISISNVIGSNIFNLGFILGGTATVHAITTSPKLVYRDGFFLIAVTCLLGFFLFDYHLEGSLMALSRWEGIILLVILVAYMLHLFIKKEELEEEEIPHGKVTFFDVILLLLGFAGVVGGGHLLVDASTIVAREFGVSDWVIGVTIVAAGTSMPEFATSIMALIKGKHGMAIGNLIGSDLFNLLGVLGVAGVMKESLVVSEEAQSSIIMLILMMVLVVIFMRTSWKITRWQGATLVIINLVRWFIDFTGKG
ncbi:MAG: calcium/sodium antiporter [Deltaproteobacteria bacterium]|nr:calcium/sodium antiporter [Deltaproteobacteria bacterium]